MIESQGKILNIRCGFLTLVCFFSSIGRRFGEGEKEAGGASQHQRLART